MKTVLVFTLFLALAPAATLAFAQSAPPSLFTRALDQPDKAQLYAFDFVDVTEGDSPNTIMGRIDPSRPKGQRVTFTSVKGKVDMADTRKKYERNAGGDIWCDSLTRGADGAIADKGADGGAHLFAFTPLPPKLNPKDTDRQLYKQLSAEMAVDEATGRIRWFNAVLTKSWKPVFIAKVDHVELKGECTLAPNGRSYAARMRTYIVGNMMGFDMSQNLTRTVNNLKPVARAGN